MDKLNDIPTSSLIWVRNADYDQQLFLGDYYEQIWQRPKQSLIDDPLSFDRSIAWEHQSTFHYQPVVDGKQDESMNYFVIHDGNGEKKFIQDHHFAIKEDGKTIAIAGIVNALPEALWENCRGKFSSLPEHKPLMQLIAQAVPGSGNRFIYLKTGERISITPRQFDILECTLKGMTAKITAKALNISHRTVEEHLANLREKTNSTSLLALVAKIDSLA